MPDTDFPERRRTNIFDFPDPDAFFECVAEDGQMLVITESGDIVETPYIEEYMARGRLTDCDCRLIQCVCAEARRHQKDCRYRFAMTCAIPFSCEPHGRDVCSECDPCACFPKKETDEA